jgi:4-amino-4-deoxy-L-arabinose transferase-like glycosyltransferase
VQLGDDVGERSRPGLRVDPSSEGSLRRGGSIGVLLAAAALLFALSGRGFWDPDEPRFAQVAREMLASGDWVLPRFNGQPLALLPPLTYWSSAAASWIAGDVTQWTARVGVTLFALLALAGTMVIPSGGGAWAGLVLLSSAKFLHQAQYLQADMLLVGSVTWVLAALYRAYVGTGRRGLWLLSAYAASGLGVLAKGPLGALLPAAVFTLFLLWEGDLRALRGMGLLWGAPLVAAIAAPWYVAVCIRGGEAFCQELLLKHNFGMFVDTWSHERPFYYYLVQLPWMFMPWTIALPLALGRLSFDRETRFLASWIAFALLFFSVSDAKQAKYLLPILPPLAVLVGEWLHARATPRALGAMGVSLGVALAVAATLAGIALPERLPGAELGAATSAATGAACFVLAAILARRRALACALLAAGVPACALVARFALVPTLETFKLPRALTEEALRRRDPVAIYGISYRQAGGLVYYTGRLLPVLDSREAFEAWMNGSGPRLVFVPVKVPLDGHAVLLESPYREGTRLVSNRRREQG